MAKFQTNVAGVTHYNVDFSSIKKSSYVEIIPEPHCPYDDCALRVIINGRHVGYIKRGFNRTIYEEMKLGSKVSAKVKAVVGGDAGKNYGIVLDLIVDDGQTKLRAAENLGITVESKDHEIRVIRSPRHPIPIERTEDIWMEFLQERKGLPKFLDPPREPNYQVGYDIEVPWLTRLWGESFESYRDRKRKEWIASLAELEDKNSRIHKLLEHFNGNREVLASEFNAYHYDSKLRNLLHSIKASVTLGISANISPYVTIYERSIFYALKSKVRNVFHQSSIDGRSVDILCIPDELTTAWAIEIDGGIHRRMVKMKRDAITEQALIGLGVSLIRIPNHIVSRSPEACCSRILEIIAIV